MRIVVVRWIINAIALWVVSHLNVGVSYESIGALLIAALAIGFANAVVRPILKFLTMPLTCMTLGLFSYVLSFILFYVVGQVVPGFDVEPAGAVIGAVLLSIVSGALSHLLINSRR